MRVIENRFIDCKIPFLFQKVCQISREKVFKSSCHKNIVGSPNFCYFRPPTI